MNKRFFIAIFFVLFVFAGTGLFAQAAKLEKAIVLDEIKFKVKFIADKNSGIITLDMNDASCDHPQQKLIMQMIPKLFHYASDEAEDEGYSTEGTGIITGFLGKDHLSFSSDYIGDCNQTVQVSKTNKFAGEWSNGFSCRIIIPNAEKGYCTLHLILTITLIPFEADYSIKKTSQGFTLLCNTDTLKLGDLSALPSFEQEEYATAEGRAGLIDSGLNWEKAYDGMMYSGRNTYLHANPLDAKNPIANTWISEFEPVTMFIVPRGEKGKLKGYIMLIAQG